MRLKCFRYLLLTLTILNGDVLLAQQTKVLPVETGVSHSLAAFRKTNLSDIHYDLHFRIPSQKAEAVVASEILSFNLKAKVPALQLDFKQPREQVSSITVNDLSIAIDARAEHLVIAGKHLRTGTNKVVVQFIAGDASLNRNDDYLYALFVPANARTVFPCFDQPDLKAKFDLNLQVPTGWTVLANGAKKDSVVDGTQTTYRFATSDKLSTYLFSFSAGKFKEVVKNMKIRTMELLHRETDSAKLALSLDSIFILHQNAISFLEAYTGILYPFQKVGFAVIPDFQFGGMEHPGAVDYKASSLFLDETATKDAHISRISLISHETAHMWFGDLVTMRWFNDVWMKEVFANFMADKVTEDLMGSETFNLKFLQDHYPAAYSIDRTAGAHPIRQMLSNLQEAGSLYGNIIYHKAPIMMRQLELLMGKESFRKGLQEYLKTYAYDNADWPQLINILNNYTKVDLKTWNQVWVNEAGRPVFNYDVDYVGGKINRLQISQSDAGGKRRIWPQTFAISFIYPDEVKTVTVQMKGSSLVVNEARGMRKPLGILLNSDGLGYGLFPVDNRLSKLLPLLKSPLSRASAYISLYENMLEGRNVMPDSLLQLFTQQVSGETNEMNLRLLTGYLNTIYWVFITPAKRKALSKEFEEMVWKAMEQQTEVNNKKILFKAFQDVYQSAEGQERMYTVWQKQQPPSGVKLSEDDYTALALTIVLKNDTATNVLKTQEERIKNEDRKKRFQFLMPALSPDVKIRDSFFYSLRQRNNRGKEAWVTTALAYLHHPLRQQTSIKYLPESLDMLEEIQRTGDIFFPQSWLGAIFSYYQNTEAATVVRKFLKSHPSYNPKLKNKISQATDNLFRAERIVKTN